MTNEEAIEHIKLILLRDRNNELHFVSHDEEIALALAIKAIERGDRYDEGYLDGMSGADWKGEEE